MWLREGSRDAGVGLVGGKEEVREGAGADVRGMVEHAWRFARRFSVWDAEGVEEETGASCSAACRS